MMLGAETGNKHFGRHRCKFSGKWNQKTAIQIAGGHALKPDFQRCEQGGVLMRCENSERMPVKSQRPGLPAHASCSRNGTFQNATVSEMNAVKKARCQYNGAVQGTEAFWVNQCAHDKA